MRNPIPTSQKRARAVSEADRSTPPALVTRRPSHCPDLLTLLCICHFGSGVIAAVPTTSLFDDYQVSSAWMC
jgi:hypothetical protein